MPRPVRKIKPTVLVTGPSRGGFWMWNLSRMLIWRHGGKARRFTPDSQATLHDFDALLLGGGSDIDPALYGEDVVLNKSSSFNRGHDDKELALLEQALSFRKPVLGTCRGMQLINVFFGGTLFQDISGFFPNGKVLESRLPFKDISWEKSARLCDRVGSDVLKINSMHTQALKGIATALHAVAKEDVGIIQAVEGRDPSLKVVGVQWHPEFLFYMPRHRKLFLWLITEAKIAMIRT